MTRTYAWRNGQLVELTPQDVEAIPQVMPDLKEFRSPDGKHISSRSKWREHLKRTGSVEMGFSDVKAQQAKWAKKKEAFQERLDRKHVHEVAAPEGEIRESERSRIGAEVANRLDQRPAPDRKTLLKLTLETARELSRRR